MNPLLLMKSFYEHLETHELSPNALALYLVLFNIQNVAGWPPCFKIRTAALQIKTRMTNEKATQRARDELYRNGFINYVEAGGSGMGTYSLIPLYETNYNNPKQDERDETLDESVLLDTEANNLSDKITPFFVAQTSPINVINKFKQNIKESKTGQEPDTQKQNPESYDSIVAAFTQDDSLRRAIFEYIKMRKLNNKKLTNEGLKLVLQDLKKYSTNQAQQTKIIHQSIKNGWSSLHPLKQTDIDSGIMRREYTQEQLDGLIDSIEHIEF